MVHQVPPLPFVVLMDGRPGTPSRHGVIEAGGDLLRRPRGTWYGLPFGATVWAVDCAVLPAAGLYKPIQDYDRETLAKDLTAHLVYGTTTAAIHRLLSPLTRLTRHEADLFYR
jgi:hypothetical protein